MTVFAPDYPGLLRLDGKGVVVLGSGAGIGGQVARAMMQAGARLMCVDLDETVAQATASSVGGIAMVADITRRSEVERVFAMAAEAFGDDLYGVVDVVGVPIPGALEQQDDAAIDRQFDLVLRHALLAVQIAGPMLATRGKGFIVLVASLAGRQVAPTVPLYGIMKAGLMALVEAAAHRFAPDGVRINAVAPGRIANSGRVRPRPDQVASISAAIPLRRLGEPHEVAGPILFLASELSSYVSGQVLVADGGIGNVSALPVT